MDVIRRGTLAQAASVLKDALNQHGSGPLTMAFALRLDQDSHWAKLGPESRRKIAESIEMPLQSCAKAGDFSSLFALHAIGKPITMDLSHVSRELCLRLFSQSAGMHTCRGVASLLAERILAFDDTWNQPELTQFLLGVTHIPDADFIEKCAALVPEGPLLPELAAACWRLRQTRTFPLASVLTKDITLQSVAALAFLKKVQSELDTDITVECLRLPLDQLAAFCEDRAIWSIVRPEAIVERLATYEMQRPQLAAICTHVAPPSRDGSTDAYDLLVEGLVDGDQQVRPVAPLTRNLARLPLESETVANVLPFLTRSAQSQLSPHTLVAFEEFNAAHGGDISLIFGHADPSAFSVDETCLSLSAATKLVRRQSAGSASESVPGSMHWAEQFFERHCARLLILHETSSLEDCHAYQLNIIAGAFRVLRSSRLSEAEGRLVELLAQGSRTSSLVRGMLEEIGRTDSGVDARLPRDRMRDFMKSESQTVQPKKTLWQRLWG